MYLEEKIKYLAPKYLVKATRVFDVFQILPTELQSAAQFCSFKRAVNCTSSKSDGGKSVREVASAWPFKNPAKPRLLGSRMSAASLSSSLADLGSPS